MRGSTKMPLEIAIAGFDQTISENVVASYSLVYNGSLMVADGLGYMLCLKTIFLLIYMAEYQTKVDQSLVQLLHDIHRIR